MRKLSYEEQIIEEYAKRNNLFGSINLNDLLFKEQLDFINDPAKYKIATTTRQAGKTTADAYYLIKTAYDNELVDVVYCTLTRSNAKKLIWRDLKQGLKKLALTKQVKFDNTELTITFKNGSVINLCGAKDGSDIEKLRGLRNKLVILDESDFFKIDMYYFIFQIIRPTLIKHNGSLVLTGTPASTKSFAYYIRNYPQEKYIHQGHEILFEGWKKFHWTIFNNIHIPHAQEFINEEKRMTGWDESTPAFRREWMGLDSIDDSIMIYKFNEAKNIFSELPAEWSNEQLNYIISIDLGFDDAFCCSVIAYSDYDDCVYVLDTYKKSGLIPDEWAEIVLDRMKKYPRAFVTGDCGALGKAIAEQMRIKFSIPIIASEKKDKLAFIDLLNGDFKSGKVFLKADNPAIKEYQTLQKDERGKEDGRCQNDAADSILYGYRHAYTYLKRERQKKTEKYGTNEYFQQEAKRIEIQHIKALKNKKKNWWE